MMKNLIFFCCSLFFADTIANAQSSYTDKEFYVIQLAAYSSIENFYDNKKPFESLNKYGVVEPDIKPNGFVQVYLKKFNGYFENRKKANDILRKVRRYRTFRKAYIKKMENSSFFNQPDISVGENEIVISFRVGGNTTSVSGNESVIPDEFSGRDVSSSLDYYQIQLGVFNEKKPKKLICDKFNFSQSEINNYKDYIEYDWIDGKRKYLFGKFPNKESALIRKKQFEDASNEKLYIILKKWNGDYYDSEFVSE